MTRSERIAFQTIEALRHEGYWDDLLRIDRVLVQSMWVTGGWIRAQALDVQLYAGDIDCVSALPVAEIRQRLKAENIAYATNRNGGLRVEINEANHVDIIPAEHFLSSNEAFSIESVLSRFNFSVNSAAVRIESGECICTEEFLSDTWERRLRVNFGFRCKSNQYFAFFRDLDFLRGFYQLTPGDDEETNQFIHCLDQQKKLLSEQPPESLLAGIGDRIGHFLPQGESAWVVRGYVRNALLGTLSPWDDVDIVTTCSEARLQQILDEHQIYYSFNIFGSPKVMLDDGTPIDIWSLGDGSIGDAVGDFSINLDALAWSLHERCFVDTSVLLNDAGTRASVQKRFIRSASTQQLDYCALKIIYLALRHNVSLDEDTYFLLDRKLPKDVLLRKNALRLIQELISVVGFDEARRRILYIAPAFSADTPLAWFHRLLEWNGNSNDATPL